MAEPPTNPIQIDKANCPTCGSEVMARPSENGDEGKAFQCPNCNTLFGVVPGLAEPP
jgi:DNA-directed RNA polymerase subunit RPC12/RpoP